MDEETKQRIERLETALLITQTERFNMLQVFFRLDTLVRILELDEKEVEHRIKVALSSFRRLE